MVKKSPCSGMMLPCHHTSQTCDKGCGVSFVYWLNTKHFTWPTIMKLAQICKTVYIKYLSQHTKICSSCTFSVFSPQVSCSSQDWVQACMAICLNWWLQEKASRAVWRRWTSMVVYRISSMTPCFAAVRLSVDAKVHRPSNPSLTTTTQTSTPTPAPAALFTCSMQTVALQPCIHTKAPLPY